MKKDEYYAIEKPLSKEVRKELFAEFSKTKDREIRDILIEEHLYIAEILAKKYTNRGIDYDDIFQVASMGLIYAVERYNPDKGFEFSSFATPTIVGEIKKYFRDKGWTIRVPRRVQELSKKINNAKVHLAQEYQKTPTIQEIADYLGSTPEEVLEVMEASKVYTPQSLDLTYEGSGDDREVNLVDLIGEDEQYFGKIELNDFLGRAMEKFNDVEKTILIDRYYHKKTQVSIAEKLGISQMTVSRIEKKVLEKMRKEVIKSADY
ncbi:SigB/SigF/SigG family RNA polymerase sigma factor [Peptoniphilus sp. KCTC 25270]|uniref:SigB/SigF/SigG family RNA polymerase sigma factor n=1 Tax=Peptoniphilus sp. KCTC 25270 TaxID=2897414 RepID=UPI001E54016A|nr:SigB/SigF/SigG family RNA polymerase sigma factor [Peptoniphilus sp. KCTC 25270]MCD1147919.1 SigB/SigF/SigG family RNA polymerase sigma factor [Peptoniphilus sp. KCTC 25270]